MIYISEISRIVKKTYVVEFNNCHSTFFATEKQARAFVKWANKNDVDAFSIDAGKWQRDNDFDDQQILEHKELFKRKNKPPSLLSDSNEVK